MNPGACTLVGAGVPSVLIGRQWLKSRRLYHVRSISLIPVGARSPIIFAKNGQSPKPAPAIVLWAIDRT